MGTPIYRPDLYGGDEGTVRALRRGNHFRFTTPSAKLPPGRLLVVQSWGEHDLKVAPWSLACRDEQGTTHYLILNPATAVSLA